MINGYSLGNFRKDLITGIHGRNNLLVETIVTMIQLASIAIQVRHCCDHASIQISHACMHCMYYIYLLK